MTLCVTDYSNELERKKKPKLHWVLFGVLGVGFFFVNQSNKVNRSVTFLLFALEN